MPSTSTSMSAHRCFTAWNEPIGRPNCTRSFAYSTAISSARDAPPSISSDVAVAPRSSNAVTRSPPPRRQAGVRSKSSQATGRVRSMAGSADGRPRTSRSTPNNAMPSARRRDHEREVGDRRERNRIGPAGEHPLARRPLRAHCFGLATARDAHPHVAGEGALDRPHITDAAEHLDAEDGRKERCRRHVPADLLEQHAELDGPEPDPAFRLGDRDGEPALVHHGGPQVPVPPLGHLGHGPDAGGGREIVEECTGAVPRARAGPPRGRSPSARDTI